MPGRISEGGTGRTLPSFLGVKKRSRGFILMDLVREMAGSNGAMAGISKTEALFPPALKLYHSKHDVTSVCTIYKHASSLLKPPTSNTRNKTTSAAS